MVTNWFVTGDKHGNFYKILSNDIVQNPDNAIIILGDAGLNYYLNHVVVGAVPVGAGLVGHLREDVVHLLRVEGGGHADRLGIDGVAVLAHAVAGLAPPVVGGDAEAVDGNGFVHHQTHFLLGGEQGDQVLHAILDLEFRVLERILVHLLGAAACQQEEYQRKG